jgi:type II secretion system protein G
MSIRSAKGFTLIELLVVVAIIGLLSSVVLVSLDSARAKARNTQRLADLREIRTALEVYRNENGSYPSTSNAWRGSCAGFGPYPNTGAGAWIPGLAPKYMSVLPSDPRPTADGNGCYVYRSDGVNYKVMAQATVEPPIISTGTYQGASLACNLVPGPTNTNPANNPKIPSASTFAFYTPTLTACAW